jgi:hypothetical protein
MPSRQRRGPIGSVGPGRSFNHFPAIMKAFPDVIGDIIVETTEAIGDDAAARAPVGEARPDAPPPGTLRASKKTRYGRDRGGHIVSGRIDFKAKDPTPADPSHLYPFYVEVGTHDTAAQPFLVPAVVEHRSGFLGELGDLESRLPQ